MEEAEGFRHPSPPLAGGSIDRARLSVHFFGRTSGLGVGGSRPAVVRFRLPTWRSAPKQRRASTSSSRPPAAVLGSPAASRLLLAVRKRLPASDPGLIPATASFRNPADPRQAVRSLRNSFYSHLMIYARPEFSRKRLGRFFTSSLLTGSRLPSISGRKWNIILGTYFSHHGVFRHDTPQSLATWVPGTLGRLGLDIGFVCPGGGHFPHFGPCGGQRRPGRSRQGYSAKTGRPNFGRFDGGGQSLRKCLEEGAR